MSKTPRETFSSNFGLLMTMIGVAVGLGNIWRFPYMVGKFGGSAFVVVYIVIIVLIGIPAMMSEWSLGRYTRRGTLGAFEKGGLPGGKYVGYFFFIVVIFATSYYTNAVAWVAYYGFGEILRSFSISLNPAEILPPNEGFNGTSMILQLVMTFIVVLSSVVVLVKGLRSGIEKTSKIIIPTLFIILMILIIRSLTLDGSEKGLIWYLGSFKFSDIDSTVLAAAMGQAIFSLSLGGTFMLIYGSYMKKESSISRNATFTVFGDTFAGLLAGLAIFPAVFAFNLEVSQGPALLFSTLPKMFAAMPLGSIFGILFFFGLFGAAYLSNIAAFEVLIGGLVDNTKLTRKKATYLLASIVFTLAIVPMINMNIFGIWDLFFGSGMQTLGALITVITAAWFVKRADLLKELSPNNSKYSIILYWWMRLVIPLAILLVGLNWLNDNVG